MKSGLFTRRTGALLFICAFLGLFAAPAAGFDIVSAGRDSLQTEHGGFALEHSQGERSAIIDSVSGEYSRSSIISRMTGNSANSDSWEPTGGDPAEPAVTTVPTTAPALMSWDVEKILAVREAYQTRSRISQLSAYNRIPRGVPGGPAAPVNNSSAVGDPMSVVEANNRFAFEMYHRLAGDPGNAGENIFFSPFSISAALAITGEGARGQTADEIWSVFHFPEDATVMREGYASIMAAINRGASGYILRTANALWAEQTYPFLPEYLSTADQHYDAKTSNLDFVGHPEESRVIINDWVEEQTEDLIQDLIPPGVINPDTRLVITNAIYFKGTWVKQFDPESTSNDNFRTASGEIVQVPMMQRTDEDAVYGYAETDRLQALSMPYASDDEHTLSMIVILPKDGDLEAVQEFLDADTLENIRSSLASKQVEVYFPRFTMETKYSLAEALCSMGMPTAFSPQADFSGMDGTGCLLISDVIHQAFVEVNEEGTEAAAATAVVMELTAYIPPEPVPVFRADHPFIFFIQDDETGNILFMGRVANPATS